MEFVALCYIYKSSKNTCNMFGRVKLTAIFSHVTAWEKNNNQFQLSLKGRAQRTHPIYPIMYTRQTPLHFGSRNFCFVNCIDGTFLSDKESLFSSEISKVNFCNVWIDLDLDRPHKIAVTLALESCLLERNLLESVNRSASKHVW
jgi:hypothetical protein